MTAVNTEIEYALFFIVEPPFGGEAENKVSAVVLQYLKFGPMT